MEYEKRIVEHIRIVREERENRIEGTVEPTVREATVGGRGNCSKKKTVRENCRVNRK